MVEDFTPDVIEDGLWVGRAPRAPEEFACLRDLGVQDVLTLQTEDEARHGGILPPLAFRIAVANGLALHRVEIPDMSPSALRVRTPRAALLLKDLRGRGRRVYVHCAIGLNRSPTIVAAYLVLSRGLEPDAACALVESLHPSVPDRDAVRALARAKL
jgi:hypothetical protein